MERKKILIIIPFLPYPLTSGGHQALYNGIASIYSDYSVTLSYVAYNGEEYYKAAEEYNHIFPKIKLLPLILPGAKEFQQPLLVRLGHYAKKTLKRILGYKTVRMEEEQVSCDNWFKNVLPQSPAFCHHITKVCKETYYDLIQVEMPTMLSSVLCLPRNTKRLYVHHEIGFVRSALDMKGHEDDAYLNAVYDFCKTEEIRQLNLYDAITTLSTIDSYKLEEAGVKQPIFTSFATVNSNTDSSFTIGDGLTLSFVGPGYHVPNRQGLRWFLENCWSNLKEENPNYKLNVVGVWEDEFIGDIPMKYKDVNFCGFVDCLKDVLAGTIMIVPILSGSGIRMKILEAASNCIPLVSTTVGAEGIPLKNEYSAFIADLPDDFVKSILKLRDINLQKRIIENANQMVKSHYSIDALSINRKNIYTQIFKS